MLQKAHIYKGWNKMVQNILVYLNTGATMKVTVSNTKQTVYKSCDCVKSCYSHVTDTDSPRK